MNPEEIEAALEKIDFKLTKQMFLDKPLYCKPLKNTTPVKKDPPSRDENKQDLEEDGKNGQNDDLEEVMESGEGETNIVKPKFFEDKLKKKARNGSNRSGGIDKFLPLIGVLQNPKSQNLEKQLQLEKYH